MSINDYINRVRYRSEADKQRIVFVWTSVLIVVIFLIWVVSFSLSLSSRNAEELRLRAEAQKLAEAQLALPTSSDSTISNQETTENTQGLLPQFYQLISDGVDSIANGFWVIGDMIHK